MNDIIIIIIIASLINDTKLNIISISNLSDLSPIPIPFNSTCNDSAFALV